MNDSVLRFDKFSVEVSLAQYPKQDLDSKIWQFSSELDLVVSISALFAAKRGDDDLSEEGNFGHENGSFPILFTVGAQTFNDSG